MRVESNAEERGTIVHAFFEKGEKSFHGGKYTRTQVNTYTSTHVWVNVFTCVLVYLSTLYREPSQAEPS